MIETYERYQRQKKVRDLRDGLLESVYTRAPQRVQQHCLREQNLLLNELEYNLGKIQLESTPEGVGIGAHFNCNAKCIFCLGGKPKLFSLQRYKEFFEPKLGHILAKARYANFCGFGELLFMPNILDFLDHVNRTIPEVNKIYTTNGSPLLIKDVAARLSQTPTAVEISLHASNRQLHHTLTRLNNFDRILQAIREIIKKRQSTRCPHIVLVFLANTLNVEDLPDFVKLAAELQVDEVACNYISIFHPTHLKFSCYFKQKSARESFKKAEQVAKKLKMPLRLPPCFGDKVISAKRRMCSDPWKYFYVENETSVLPCCFAGDHVGYLGEADFATIWNGYHYKNLRRGLWNSQPGEWCQYCYKYREENIHDIRAHINFRPGFRDRILKGIKL